jgi:nicotinamide-nucleotide amidase
MKALTNAPLDAEIIAVGSEMLTAERVDTNSLYLTGELNNLGVEVVFKCVIGDHRDRLADAVQRALGRSAIVILSGGLGPTEDDVTREAVAQALGRQLIFRPAISAALEQRFARTKRKMSEVNKRQAFVMEGAEVLLNDRGTAPGQWIEASGSVAILLPGPPHELKSMFARECLPRLARLVPRQAIRTAFLRITGMPESDLDALISPVYKKYQNPVTTILAASGDLQVHLRARCSTVEEAEVLLSEVTAPIAALLGDRLYSRTGDPLEVVVGNLLRQQQATVAVAESCTGGMLGARFTTTPGSSDYFLGGFITYSDRLKTDLLGVSPETLKEFGAVSPETAEAMAIGARARTASTYAIAVTGIAGPGGATEQKPVGLVYVAIAGVAGTLVVNRQFLGDRQRIRIFTTQMALDLLRRQLLGLA